MGNVYRRCLLSAPTTCHELALPLSLIVHVSEIAHSARTGTRSFPTEFQHKVPESRIKEQELIKHRSICNFKSL